MRRSNNDSDKATSSPQPKVPRDAVVNSDGRPPEQDSPTITGIESVFQNPKELEAHIPDNALNMIPLVGPISAESVVDISPSAVTLGAVYEPSPDDDHIGNVCSLASHDACVVTAGTQKVDGRYIPERLEFEKTFAFRDEVESLRDLKREWKQQFSVKLSITADDSDAEGFNPF